MRYSTEDKAQALLILAQCDGDFTAASEQTDIPANTLRRWSAAQADLLHNKLRALHMQLADDALQLAQNIAQQLESAPLNQLSSALGVVLDRYLKLDEHLTNLNEQQAEQVIRIEYQYPDGSIHKTPYWAKHDFEDDSPLQSGGVRQTLRQDGSGQADDNRDGAGWRDLLVARADLHNGSAGLAGFEDDFAANPHSDD